MRDWQTYVRENLGSSRLDHPQIDEIFWELANHLEETYQTLRSHGFSDEQADLQTRMQAGNWNELRTHLISAKRGGTMTDRVRQIWIPSLVTLLTSWTILALLIWAGAPPLIWNRAEPRSAVLYLPWLLLLPLIGAFGAYISHQANGLGLQVYFVGTFPALAIAAILAVIFPFAFFVDKRVAPDFEPGSLAAMTLSWVILPALALGVGVAFINTRKRTKAGTT